MSSAPVGVIVLRVALRRAWAWILIPAVVAVLAFGVASLAPPTWTSHAMVTLNNDVGNGPSIPGVEATTAQWAVIARIATQLKLFHSRAVLSRAGERELHAELQALSGGAEAPAEGEPPDEGTLLLPNGAYAPNPLLTIVADHDGSGATLEALKAITWREATTLDADAAADPLATEFITWALSKEGPYGEKGLRDALGVQRIGESDLVTVKVSAEHQALAPRLLAATLAECAVVLGDAQRSDATSQVAFFEQRVREAGEKLQEREDQLKRFLTANDIANYIDQTRALALQIEDTRMKLAKADEDAARFARRRSGIQEALGGEDFLKDWATRGALDADLLELRRSVAGERAQRWLKGATGGDDLVEEPVPDTLEARVEAFLDGRLNGLEPHRKTLIYDWILEDLEHAGAVAGRRIQEAHLEESEEQMRRYAVLGSEIKKREREIGVAEAEYLELVRGLNAARLLARQADDVRPFSIVDTPSVPREPEPRGRALTAVMGAAIAFALVVLVILVVEQVDQSLHLPSSFEATYDLPVLGGLPQLADGTAPLDDPSPVVQTLLATTRARVANAAREAARVQLVAMHPGTGTSVLASVLGPLELPVDDRPALSVESDALRPAPDTVTVWVVDSGATLGPAEERALRDLEDAGAPVVGLVVNHLTYFGAEELLGNVPKARTRLRSFIKRLASLQWGKEGPWRPVA